MPRFCGNEGSGCGSVGRAVASDSRGLQCESSHRPKFILNVYCQLNWKDKNKEKEAGIGPIQKEERGSNSGTDCNLETTIRME